MNIQKYSNLIPVKEDVLQMRFKVDKKDYTKLIRKIVIKLINKAKKTQPNHSIKLEYNFWPWTLDVEYKRQLICDIFESKGYMIFDNLAGNKVVITANNVISGFRKMLEKTDHYPPIIKLSDYTKNPINITRVEGFCSAEAFLDDIVIPSLKEVGSEVIIDLDDIRSIRSDYLSKVFYGIVKYYGKEVMERIQIECKLAPSRILKAKSYMRKAVFEKSYITVEEDKLICS